MLSIASVLVAVTTATMAQVIPQTVVDGNPERMADVLTGENITESIPKSGVEIANGSPHVLTNQTSTPQATTAKPILPHPMYPLRGNYDIQVSTIPIPYEPRHFTERTRSDMMEFLDRAARDVDFAESQISLSAEFARSAVSNDVNEAKNFVIKNHEKQFNEALQNFIDEEFLWECAKKGEKLVEDKMKRTAKRVNDCIKRASNSAMDVVTSTKSHIAEDRTRRLQKYSEDVRRLSECLKQQERHCIREQINLIDRNVNGLAADARNEVERVRDAQRQQVTEFSNCRRFQDQSYLELLTESDNIVEKCITKSYIKYKI